MLESAHPNPWEPADVIDLNLAAMSAVWGTFTALPLILPLVGALVLWPLPSGGPMPWFRRRAAALLLAVSAALLLANLFIGSTAEYPFWRPLFATGATTIFAPDPLGSALALLAAVTVAIPCIASLAQPLERYEAAGMLWVVGAAAGIALADNLLTLCLAWAAMDLGLLFVDTVRASEEGIPRGARNALGGLLSSVALVAGAIVASRASGGGESRLTALTLDGLSTRLLMAAALLRLGIHPLPGSLKRNWLSYLGSLCAGAYLWLRLITLSSGDLPWQGWLVPLGGGVLLASGLLAFLAPDLATAVPAILLNGLTLVVLAPLIDRSLGFGVSQAAAFSLGLSLAVLRADSQVRPIPPFGRWSRVPLVLALGSLVGWPGTLGFTAHWLFLRLCWMEGQRMLLLVAAVSFLLVTVPVWSRLRHVMREVRPAVSRAASRHPSVASTRLARVALGVAASGALLLVVLGLTPTLFGLFWSGVPDLVRPTVLVMVSGNPVQFAALALTAIVFPAMGSYALQGLWYTLPGRLGRWEDTGSALLELDWLYAGIDGVLAWLGRTLARTLVAVEEGLHLGWALLWVLVVALYLVGR